MFGEGKPGWFKKGLIGLGILTGLEQGFDKTKVVQAEEDTSAEVGVAQAVRHEGKKAKKNEHTKQMGRLAQEAAYLKAQLESGATTVEEEKKFDVHKEGMELEEFINGQWEGKVNATYKNGICTVHMNKGAKEEIATIKIDEAGNYIINTQSLREKDKVVGRDTIDDRFRFVEVFLNEAIIDTERHPMPIIHEETGEVMEVAMGDEEEGS